MAQEPAPISLENLRRMIEDVKAQPATEYVARGVFYEQGGKILFIGTESRGIPTIIRNAYPGWQADFEQKDRERPPTVDTKALREMIEEED